MTDTGQRSTGPAPLDLDPRRVVVIDDDPTGTQMVSGVDVLLRPDRATFEEFFRSADRAIYVLSNTRALDRAQAVKHLRQIVTDVRQAAECASERVALVLRGDSTLRGHVFDEVDVLATPDSVTLFVPAFPEGGRTTLGGIQWIDLGDGPVPVCETEFASDPDFGYRARTLPEWVAETGQGRPARMIALPTLRSRGAAAVRDALLDAPGGCVVIPEAETRADVEMAMLGLLAAERAGREVVVRCASTFAAVRTGLEPRAVDSVGLDASARVLVVCGSHTAAGTRQVELLSAAAELRPIQIPHPVSVVDGPGSVAQPLLARVQEELGRTGTAILMSPRTFRPTSDRGAGIMQDLVEATRLAVGSFDALICKGGITSAELARSALGAARARVEGQLAPGVALWTVPIRGGQTLPYVVVPGNVGGPNLLRDLVAASRRNRSE